MANTLSYRALIRGIEKVYFRVSLIVLHKRMDSYHKQSSHSHHEHASDIHSPLLDCVDVLIVNNTNKPETIYSIDCTLTENAASNLYQHMNKVSAMPAEFNHEYVGELSKYFKERSRSTDLHPCIQEKLEHSVWEHIHATIRCARQADKRNMKIHAGIASSACKELAHYMSEQDYRAFTTEVEQHLLVLKSETTSESL